MNLINELRSLVSPEAKKRKRIQRQVVELNRSTDALIRRDIADWRQAWQMAINVDNPYRAPLYDIYRDVWADLHLSGCVEQRKGFVMAKPFKITDRKGKELPELKHYFDQGWFIHLCRLAMDSIYWGHSLIELGSVVTDGDGCPCLDGVTLIPRKHVIPEYHRIIPTLGMHWQSGVDYTDPELSRWLIEAGLRDDLGLFLKAAMQTIPKKNMLAFWDAFGEIFGMPMRIAKVATRDEGEKRRVLDMVDNMGFKGSGVFDQDTEIQFVESSRGDAYNVYDRRVDRANSEISKLIIGQTMTIEDGSSLSQSQTHLEVFENLVESDAAMLRDVINNQLIPRLTALGFPLEGAVFAWDESEAYTPEQQVAYEQMLLQNFDIDPKYFEEKYGVKVLGAKQSPMMQAPQPEGDEGKNGDEQLANNLPPFKGGMGRVPFFD